MEMSFYAKIIWNCRKMHKMLLLFSHWGGKLFAKPKNAGTQNCYMPYIIKVADYFFTSQELLEKANSSQKATTGNKTNDHQQQMILSCRGRKKSEKKKHTQNDGNNEKSDG